MNKASETEKRAKEVDRVLQKQVSASSKKQYLGHQARLACFLYEFHREEGGVVNHEFFTKPGMIVKGKVQCDVVKERLKQDFAMNELSCCPLHLRNLTAALVGQCVVWVNEENVKKGGKKNGPDAIRNVLAAVKDLFRTYNCEVSPEYQREIEKLSKGYARDVAPDREKNHRGKEALPFDVYCDIGRHTLQVVSADYVFARTFMILQWNLMCRAENTEKVELKHLNWNNDCLEVYFRKQKNDQDGSRGEVPRHVYANPVKPEVCSILALGIFFLSTARTHHSGKLFEGNSQATRFGGAFQKILESMSEKIKQHGFDPSDFGSHSNRKGSATYVTSGTPDGPGQVAVNLRGGWTMTKVENSYFRFERAGDQFVGRTVAGLPIHSASFATLPPMFLEKTPEDTLFIENAMRTCFPFLTNAESALFPVVKFALASVVYHSDWLLRNVPKNHVLIQSALFAGPDLTRLRQLVVCKLAGESDDVQATGVPRGVMTHLEIQRLRQEQKDFRNDLIEFRTSFEETLTRGLNNYAVSQGHLTMDTVKGLLSAQFESLYQKIVTGSRNHEPEIQGHHPQERVDPVSRPNLHCWGGKFHPVPESFTFTTKMPLRQAFVQWTVGNSSLGYPPFRLLKPDDMPDPKLRKTFSNLKQVMLRMEKKAKDDNIWPLDETGREKERLDASEAVFVSERVEECFRLDEATPTGRVRRQSEMAWSTVYISSWRKTTSLKGKKRLRKRTEDVSDCDSSEASESESDGEKSDNPTVPNAPAEVPASVRVPNFDVVAAYEALKKYCAEKLNLVEGQAVPGDGSCFFHLVSRKLTAFGTKKYAADIRRECVDWVLRKMSHSDVESINNLGYADWNDWGEKMRDMSHYADELCFEAVADLYHVHLAVILSSRTVSYRVISPDTSLGEDRTITIACVGDYHCYDFVPKPTQQSGSKQVTSSVVPVRKQRKK